MKSTEKNSNFLNFPVRILVFFLESGLPLTILHLQPQLMLTCGITSMLFRMMTQEQNGIDHCVATLGGNALLKFKKYRQYVVKLPGSLLYKILPLHYFQLKKVCQDQNVKVIHVHHPMFYSLARRVGKAMNIPVVATVISARAKVPAEFNKYVVYSQAIREQLAVKLRMAPEQIGLLRKSIHNLPEDRMDDGQLAEFRESLRIPAGRTIILFVGAFSREKGLDLLLRAMHRLMLEYSDLFLLLVGDGKERVFAEKYCASHLSDYLIVRPQENITPFYQMADIVVIPSREDNFTVLPAEAGIMHKPVVASALDSISQYIEHGYTGVLCEPGSYKELRTAIRVFLDDASLQVRYSNNLYNELMKLQESTDQFDELADIYNQLKSA